MKKFIFITGGLLILIILAIGFVYSDHQSWQNRIVKSLDSPDQSLRLTTQINYDRSDPTRYLCIIVEIKENTPSGDIVYREITPASSRMNWSIRWEGNDKIVLDSSDIGPYTIIRDNNGNWSQGSVSDKEEAIGMAQQFVRNFDIEVLDIGNPVGVIDQGDVWHIIFATPQEPDPLPPFRSFNIHKDTGDIYEVPQE